MRVVFRSPILRPQFEELAGRHGVAFVVPEDEAALHKALADADALWMWPDFYDAGLVGAIAPHAHRLRWVQLQTMGYDPVEAHGIPPGVTVTTAGDAFAPAVAEHALALLLALVRQVHRAARAQRWDPSIAAGIGTLVDARIAVLGFGSIGREIAQRLRACGARVVAITRRGVPHPLADEMHSVEELAAALAGADALIVAAPLTAGTRAIVGAATLAMLPPRAVVVNIARGGLVDHDALLAALRHGTIAGAGLDVTDPEPLPGEHPLWRRPDVIVTPHVAGYGGAVSPRRLLERVERNLTLYRAGAPLENAVNLVAGA